VSLRESGETTSETKLDGARLPGPASPAKVAKDGQHNNDDDDDPKPGRHVILSLGACRLYGERTRICKVCGLRREPGPTPSSGSYEAATLCAGSQRKTSQSAEGHDEIACETKEAAEDAAAVGSRPFFLVLVAVAYRAALASCWGRATGRVRVLVANPGSM
jgi:hypothetical protein